MIPHPYSDAAGIGPFTRAGAAGAAARGGVLVSMWQSLEPLRLLMPKIEIDDRSKLVKLFRRRIHDKSATIKD